MIPRPVAAIVLATKEFEIAHLAFAAFERRYFAPGTPANDMYQMIVDTSWNGVVLAVAVFPEAALPGLSDLVKRCGLSLLAGVPFAPVDDGITRYDVNVTLRRVLGIEVSDRTYVVQRSSEYYTPNQVSTATTRL